MPLVIHCNIHSVSSASSSLLPVILTMAGANSKADSFLLAVKDHVEALHDDGSHHCASAGLGDCKLIAVLLV